jgi:nicotinamide phosphoribosyltransferase
MENIMLLTDSYKATHFKQYPKGTTTVYSYLEARKGGKFDKTVFFGLQYIIKRYLEGKVVTREKIDEADAFFAKHLGPNLFNKAGWEHILTKHDGKLPVRIKAAPEGVVIEEANVLVTIENTDPECFWLTNYLETILLHVWYPTTVATLSYHMKETILKYLEKTGNPDLIAFKLHDFGFRGVSSVESAGLGGAGHLLNFMGTDTLAAITLAQQYYGADMPAFSIPASEHSTITSWGPECEADAMENMLDQYPEGLVACVSDSFDIINACKNIWGKKLRDKILARKGTLVVRPDSGDPKTVVIEVLDALGDAFGYSTNAKGYKVLPDQIRVIQGDGINDNSLSQILARMAIYGWSADNIAFGCGGALLQQMNRDTQRFAFKCSSVVVDGVERDVFKAPATDPTKNSKRGRLALIKHTGWSDHTLKNYHYTTVSEKQLTDDSVNELKTVFENGALIKEYAFDEIRRNTHNG